MYHCPGSRNGTGATQPNQKGTTGRSWTTGEIFNTCLSFECWSRNSLQIFSNKKFWNNYEKYFERWRLTSIIDRLQESVNLPCNPAFARHSRWTQRPLVVQSSIYLTNYNLHSLTNDLQTNRKVHNLRWMTLFKESSQCETSRVVRNYLMIKANTPVVTLTLNYDCNVNEMWSLLALRKVFWHPQPHFVLVTWLFITLYSAHTHCLPKIPH